MIAVVCEYLAQFLLLIDGHHTHSGARLLRSAADGSHGDDLRADFVASAAYCN